MVQFAAAAAMLGLLSSPAVGRHIENREHWSSSESSSCSEYSEHATWTSSSTTSYSSSTSYTLPPFSTTSVIEPESTTTTSETTTTAPFSSTSVVAPGSTSTSSETLTTSTTAASTSITAPVSTTVTSTTTTPSVTSTSLTTTTLTTPSTTSTTSTITPTTTLITPISTSITIPVTVPTTTTTTATTSNTASTCSSITYSGTAAPQNTALSFVDGMLDRHNYLRQFHGSTTPMVWDPVLAAAAQVEVDTCVFQHTVNNPYGENLAAMGQTGGFTSQQLVVSVDEWYAEIANYDFNNPGYDESTGHFTQVVWLGSNQLGCAWKDCSNTALGLYFIACEYAPAGNVVNDGYFAANVLSPVASVNSCSPGITSNPGRRGIAFEA